MTSLKIKSGPDDDGHDRGQRQRFDDYQKKRKIQDETMSKPKKNEPNKDVRGRTRRIKPMFHLERRNSVKRMVQVNRVTNQVSCKYLNGSSS